jgi:hypothetical protein
VSTRPGAGGRRGDGLRSLPFEGDRSTVERVPSLQVARTFPDSLGYVSVTFRELRTDEAYLSALEGEISEHLDLFRADDVPEVLNKYLGSSVHVV